MKSLITDLSFLNEPDVVKPKKPETKKHIPMPSSFEISKQAY